MKKKSWKHHGPCSMFQDPVNNAIVIYENQRPEVMDKFEDNPDQKDVEQEEAKSEQTADTSNIKAPSSPEIQAPLCRIQKYTSDGSLW